MKILVTGATGFLGAYLANRLQEERANVVGLRRSRNWREALCPGLRLLDGNLSDLTHLTELLSREKPTIIWHLGANGVDIDQRNDALALIRDNYVGTFNLLSAAIQADVRTVILAGSTFEYGVSSVPAAENHAPQPRDLYSATKAGATLLGVAFAHSQAMRVVTLRIATAYGPFEGPKRLVPTLLRCALQGESVTLSQPRQMRDWIYVEDVFQAFRSSTEQDIPSGVYNLGTGVLTSVEEMVKAVSSKLGMKGKISFSGVPRANEAETTNQPMQTNKIHRYLPKLSFLPVEEGIEKAAEWANRLVPLNRAA